MRASGNRELEELSWGREHWETGNWRGVISSEPPRSIPAQQVLHSSKSGCAFALPALGMFQQQLLVTVNFAVGSGSLTGG